MRCPVNEEEKGECSLGERRNSKDVVYQECVSAMEHNDGERVYISISADN